MNRVSWVIRTSVAINPRCVNCWKSVSSASVEERKLCNCCSDWAAVRRQFIAE